MGTLLVVFSAKGFKRLLLSSEMGSRRLGRRFLQRPMHPLMSAVLLRETRFDALQFNPQANPPHRQFTDAGKRQAEFPPAPPRCRNEVYSSYLPA